MESVQLDDARVTLQDLHLVASGRPAPLGRADVARIEGEGVTAACRLPAETALCKPALAVFPRQVEVDVVKALAIAYVSCLVIREDVDKESQAINLENGKYHRRTHMAAILSRLIKCCRDVEE